MNLFLFEVFIKYVQDDVQGAAVIKDMADPEDMAEDDTVLVIFADRDVGRGPGAVCV